MPSWDGVKIHPFNPTRRSHRVTTIVAGVRILKRDGREVDFDKSKVARAVKRAGATEDVAEVIGDRVASVLATKSPRRSRPMMVEEVQDLVEEALMAYSDETRPIAKAYIVYRADREKARLARLKPDINAIADYTHASKYSRFDADLGRRETWEESVTRRMEMDIRRFPKLETRIRQVFDQYVRRKIVLPSMRSMQFGGTAMEKNHARGYNCCFTLMDRPDAFSEMFFLLLSGCGVGYSVQKRHIRKLPGVAKIDRKHVKFFTIPDSIEGWALSLRELVDSYMNGQPHAYVEFCYDEIRPLGQQLVTSGGKAPGHVPLKRMLESIRAVFDKAQGRRLEPIEVHDICCRIAESVLAGGIRRSSLIALFSPDDHDMMTCKTGNWLDTAPHRAMANNSVVIVRGDSHQHYETFRHIFKAMKEYGEPGFFFTPHENYGCNPCGEIGLNPVDVQTGETGFGFCNLTEINAALVEDAQGMIEAAQAAAFIGTLQASYTDFPFLSQASKKVAQREALLGVSITGMMDNPLVLDQDVLRMASAAAVDMNRKIAREIGISPAARVTTVKPSGTASLLLGCVGSGIHPHHARRYIRRVTANPIEPTFQHFKSINPHMCVEKPNGDWVIEFPVQVRDDAILRMDLKALDFMRKVFDVYENWIVPGTAEIMSSPGLTHNVSCTVDVGNDEWDEVMEFAWQNRQRIAAMSFLSSDGDKKYPFAPREAITDAAGEARWNDLVSRYKSVDWKEHKETEDVTSPTAVGACEGPACEIRR